YYLEDDEIRQALAITVADMMKSIGINIKVEGGSWDVIGDNMFSSAVLMGWGSHDPHEMYNIYSGETAGEDYYNTGFYQNDKVDEYFKKALNATSKEEEKSTMGWRDWIECKRGRPLGMAGQYRSPVFSR